MTAQTESFDVSMKCFLRLAAWQNFMLILEFAKVYLELGQTSKMELLAKIVNRFKNLYRANSF